MNTKLKAFKPAKRVPRTEDLMMFVVQLEAMDYQRSTFHADLSGQPKHDFNIMNGHMQRMRTLILSKMSKEAKEQIDNLGAMAWEVLFEFMKANDKRQFLAVAKCYNEGLIQMEGFEQPVNEVPFGAVLEQGKKQQTESSQAA